MKKEYTKPLLFAESYQMVEHVAAGCNMDGSYVAHHSNGWMCSITGAHSEMTLFTTHIISCGTNVEAGNQNSPLDADLKDDAMMSAWINHLCYNEFEKGQMFSS